MTNVFQLPPADPFLEKVMQTSLDAIVLCQAVRDESKEIVDFQVVRCNRRTVEMTGLSEARMLSETMLTIDPDGHRSGIFETYKRVVETGLPTHIEHYFAGANVWMAQSLARFNDGVLGSWCDISAFKQAELERKHETQLLQAILDNTKTGIAVMESVRDELGRVVDFRFTHLNPDAGRITRRRHEDLLGQRYSVAWPEARTNGVLDWHIGVAESGEPARLNGVPITVGNFTGWYNIRISPFGDGVIATFVDITALKRAELANQEQAELLRSVLDSSSNAIIAFSAVRDTNTSAISDFRYVAHNEANRRNMGMSDEEIIGHTMLEFFPQMAENGLFDRFVTVVQSGKVVRFEQEFPEGSWVGWFEIAALKWGDGIVLTLVDITASKGHQQALEQANLDLKNANENLQQFAYIASHDLQEPLRKIVSFSDVLHKQFSPQLGDMGKDVIIRMQSAAERMSALIKDVLAYSRISNVRESFRPVSLSDVFADVCREFELNLQDAKVELEVDNLPTVQGDRSQLRQLFVNLMTNALKFRPANRQPVIRLNCQSVHGSAVPDLPNPSGMYYELSFTDNGIGFDDKHADRIFQVFQRLHPRQRYEGTGVGLAICKRVAENHHGLIVATAEPDRGATFRVYLPK